MDEKMTAGSPEEMPREAETAQSEEMEAMDASHETKEGAPQASELLAQWEGELSARENELKAGLAALRVREVRQKAREEAFDAREKERRSDMETRMAALEDEAQRQKQTGLEQSVAAADLTQRKKEWEEKHRVEEERLATRRRELDTLEEELRNNELQRLRDEIARERARLAEELTAELDAKRAAFEQERARMDAEREQLTEAREALETDRAAVEKARGEVTFDRRLLRQKEDRIEELVAERVAQETGAERAAREATIAALTQENEEICRNLREHELKNRSRESFAAIYGDNPEIITKKIHDLEDEIRALNEELSQRPARQVERECRALKDRNAILESELAAGKEEVGRLRQNYADGERLRSQNEILEACNKDLFSHNAELQKIVDTQEARIKRLTATEDRTMEREERIKSIKTEVQALQGVVPLPDEPQTPIVDEMQWLSGVEQSCKDYGFVFPRRLLYAFHTSLKISDWSIFTVLAGVSGTGKSELPRLYSSFGGLNFINIPVQPNWDSQESMLGFFNSIDNKFDAQPALRFLSQCTENFSNQMAIVLLDEMNLAHVEHYFADFLSKLELRRGMAQAPSIDVNIGAGIQPYPLNLERNILWCGTMNQDETTKTLSDKVLDRGVVITFPRPEELKSRNGMRNLSMFTKERNIVPLHRKVWNAWRQKQLRQDNKAAEHKCIFDRGTKAHDKMEDYRKLLNNINECLAPTGRAVGHRVWQSIEFYVANYPTVIAEFHKANETWSPALERAMRDAMEDQIVQKIMPKLRGIDTTGRSYEECLRPIRGLLGDERYEFQLTQDFDLACEMGYGQFMWGSAEYLGTLEQENAPADAEPVRGGTADAREGSDGE